MDTQRIYFKNLDILRFLSAYAIVLLHCFFGWKAFFGHPAFITDSLSPTLLARLEIFVHNFSFGVDVFFIISGFLITYLLLSENARTGKVEVMKFYIRRAFRIWPLYFLLVLTAPLLTYFFFEPSPTYAYHFLFAGNFDIINNGAQSVATNHLWSICIEEHFYLFCPLLIAYIPVKRLPQALLGIIFASFLFRGYLSQQPYSFGTEIYMNTLSRIDVLALGSLMGYLFFFKKLKFNHPLPVRLLLYTVFLVNFIFVDYAECGTFFAAASKKYFFVLLVSYWAGNFLFHPKALLAVNRPNVLHRLGKMSYGIYMFNPVIIFLLLKMFVAFDLHNYFFFLALVHVCMLAAIVLSFRFIEQPFLALKEKYAVIKSGEPVKEPAAEISNPEGELQEPEVIPLGNVENG
jgi:peptidoglycan/LPS O-acetylase OafA/YrhL